MPTVPARAASPPRPNLVRGGSSCGYAWNVGGWSACSDNCKGGYQTRDIYCRRSDGSVVPDAYCGGKPAAIQQCSNPSAPECAPAEVATHNAVVTYRTDNPGSSAIQVVAMLNSFSPSLPSSVKTIEIKLDPKSLTHQMCVYGVTKTVSWPGGSTTTCDRPPEKYSSIKLLATGKEYPLNGTSNMCSYCSGQINHGDLRVDIGNGVSTPLLIKK